MSEEDHCEGKAIIGIISMILVSAFFIYHYIVL
jgi:hypothetical protein